MPDGFVVYEPTRNRVHLLNHTAAVVFELCTGDNEISRIPGLLQAAYNLIDCPETEVDDCHRQLGREGLIN